MIGDEAHRIDGLPGGSRRHQHPLPGQILFAGNLLQHIFQEYALFRHPAVAAVAICQHPALRRNDLIAEAGQLLKVVLDDGIMVHIVIHGR